MSKLDGYNRSNSLSEEYCPHCDEYFEVDPKKLEWCPGNCGNKLYPCNECHASFEEHAKCDWEEEGCYMFKESEADG
jgi:hypothetical protein